jgi:SAM-dependent methyltransferase
LTAFAALERGMHVLDIGCGCGTTTLKLAEACAPGRVLGVDISAPMLAAARIRAAGAAVEFVEADASTMKYVQEYDLVFSRFGVMFFADPVAAFAHIRTALMPDGRLALSCWCAMKENDWVSLPFEAARDLVPPQAPQDPHAPGQFAFADDNRVHSILTGAGFRDIHIERLATKVKLGVDVDDAANGALNSGALLRAAAELDEATCEVIRVRLRKLMTQYATPDGVALPGACWLVGAGA